MKTNNTNRGSKSVNVSFSTNGTSFSSPTNFTFDQAPGADAYTGQSFALNQTTSARYVKFDILSNQGDNSRVGLGQVRFLAIPEPASVALIGLGGIMLLTRRRA